MNCNEYVRCLGCNGEWIVMPCRIMADSVTHAGRSARISVPEMNGEWLISPEGMFGNVGGNDWAIYTLHPDDCARLVAKAAEGMNPLPHRVALGSLS